jgi:hypothetical protein
MFNFFDNFVYFVNSIKEEKESYLFIYVPWICRILLYLSNKCVIYINNICFLQHCYTLQCWYVILGECLVIYGKVTKLNNGNVCTRGCYKESIRADWNQ